MKTTCDGCGKDMKDPNTGDVSVGLYVGPEWRPLVSATAWTCVGISMTYPPDNPFLAAQYGRFHGKELAFCWECFLESLTPPMPHAAGLTGEDGR